MGKWWNNLIWAGLGAGAFYLYEQSPSQMRFGGEYRGQRARGHLGGVYEALAWENAGGPPGTSMAGGQANRKRSRSRRR